MTASRLFQTFEECEEYCQRLLSRGYRKNGQWTLGQICWHLRTTMDDHRKGYPRWMSLFAPLRPIFRALLLPRLLRGDSPKGIRTASVYVPPETLEDATEVQLLGTAIRAFRDNDRPLAAHPGFGRMDKMAAERFHCAHASHHLNFLCETTESD